MRMVYGLVLTLALSAFGGCRDSGSAPAMYRNYLYRLGNVSGIDAPSAQLQHLLAPYPRRRELLLPTTDLRVGFTDFVALWDCELGSAIGERNSGLGRVQQASGRLLYEMEFLATARRCATTAGTTGRDRPGVDEKLQQQLRTIIAVKSGDLRNVFWNSTFAGTEFQHLLSVHTKPPGRDEVLSTDQVDTSLGYLLHLGSGLEGNSEFPAASDLEKHLFNLQTDHTVGKLLVGLELSLNGLDLASGILEQARSENRLCRDGIKTPRAEYLYNVFRKFYIAEIQQYLNRIHTPGQKLLTRLQELAAVIPFAKPRKFQTWEYAYLNTDNPHGLWQRYHAQLSRHTQAWQHLLKKCRMMPGGAAPANRRTPG